MRFASAFMLCSVALHICWLQDQGTTQSLLVK